MYQNDSNLASPVGKAARGKPITVWSWGCCKHLKLSEERRSSTFHRLQTDRELFYTHTRHPKMHIPSPRNLMRSIVNYVGNMQDIICSYNFRLWENYFLYAVAPARFFREFFSMHLQLFNILELYLSCSCSSGGFQNLFHRSFLGEAQLTVARIRAFDGLSGVSPSCVLGYLPFSAVFRHLQYRPRKPPCENYCVCHGISMSQVGEDEIIGASIV